jgi:deferrochelatase/peroxidase EfeB
MAGSCPMAGRRGLLAGLAGAGAGLALPARATMGATDPADIAYPFHGPHQAGVTTPPQPAGLVAAFDVLATDRAGLERLLRTLTARIAFLTRGGPVPQRDPKLPPLDSGLMGPVVRPDGLTVTVSLGASLFDRRFGLAALRPRHLHPMTRFPNDALDAALCHGDLALQICSHRAETNLHALRDIIKWTPDTLAPRWKREGFLPLEPGRAMHETPRNLMGFKDGTANPDAGDAALMRRYVWVGADRAEPAWAVGGSYQVVRIIRMQVEHWDRTPLGEQQTIFGRDRETGAPLGQAREHDVPDYASDPEGRRIPLDAHIRLANPRTAETAGSVILRRPYSYSHGLTRAGQMDMGLLFIVYQADLAAGFLAVQARLNGEPLEEYIKPVGGGYFFALPGVREGGFLGEGLLAA